MEPYELAALQAVEKARDAYYLAEVSGNPYAAAMVTQRLAEGDLIRLSVAHDPKRGEK